MRVFLVTHPACLEHRTGALHPERPARLEAVLSALRDPALRLDLVEVEAPAVERHVLELVHEPDYIDALERFCAAGGGALDADTKAVTESWEAALRACGAGPEAVERLRGCQSGIGFVAVRPPGHHALPARPLGFCLFNNVAVTAALLGDEGASVAVVDWDVHHGNGTQSVFYERPDVLYLSIHEFPAYPGTGWLEERGSGAGEGFTINVPVPPGTAGDVYKAAFDRLVVPVLERFGPDWVLVSAGYDAHKVDPLAGGQLMEDDYRGMAGALAAASPKSRLIFFLEGGYDLDALAGSAAATCLGAHSEAWPEPSAPGPASPEAAWRRLEQSLEAAGRFWPLG